MWINIVVGLRLVSPPTVIVENVVALKRSSLEYILSDLGTLGYDAAWESVRATTSTHRSGANHVSCSGTGLLRA
jgi:site-specific DNA-cytosine methylase